MMGVLQLSVISLNEYSCMFHLGIHFEMIELVHLFRLDSLGIIRIRFPEFRLLGIIGIR